MIMPSGFISALLFIFILISILLVGFAMGQQSTRDNCKRYGMFENSGDTYSCQKIKSNFDVIIVER